MENLKDLQYFAGAAEAGENGTPEQAEETRPEREARTGGADAAAPGAAAASAGNGTEAAPPAPEADEAEAGAPQSAAGTALVKLVHQISGAAERYPGFRYAEEMRDARFRHLTSSAVGLSMEEAYAALHHREIEEQVRTEAAAHAAEALARSVQAGRGMPVQNGISGRGSVPLKPRLYSAMDREERAAYKRQLQQGRR